MPRIPADRRPKSAELARARKVGVKKVVVKKAVAKKAVVKKVSGKKVGVKKAVVKKVNVKKVSGKGAHAELLPVVPPALRASLFGTDGIRGPINQSPVTARTMLELAMAASEVLDLDTTGAVKRVVIGKDTRLGNYMLESALEAGFTSQGVEVILLGPAPTPAVAMLTRTLRADLGVMISASHNSYQDSGLKLFGADGCKLPDAVQRKIAARLGLVRHHAPADALGRARRLDDAIGRYIEFVKMSFPENLRLDGQSIVLDCAHGAAYKVAPAVLRELGAEVHVIGAAPDGRNINAKRGALAPRAMCQAVRREKARLGLALDGDADRVVFADERGRIIAGDQILALIARAWQGSGKLCGNAVVATVMSNLGLEKFLAECELELVRTAVGDRNVFAAMRARNCNLGGEESGHYILSDFVSTGDGLIAALQVIAILLEDHRPASKAAALFKPVPQKRANVPVQNLDCYTAPAVARAVKAARAQLGDKGRVLVRASGTEPLVRVMVETKNRRMAKALCEVLSDAVRAADARAGSKP